MKICENVHQLKIDFDITAEISRHVNVYIIVGHDGLYLIDAGVHHADQEISEYLESIGHDLTEVKAIFLTHAHPDHMGAAAAIQEASGCRVYGPEQERRWIENMQIQFRERPVLNFHSLLNRSVRLDYTYEDGGQIVLEPGLTLRSFFTPGHSAGSTSLLLEERHVLFIGDAVPLTDEIPIYINFEDSVRSMEKIGRLNNVDLFCCAWGSAWTAEEGRLKIEDAIQMLTEIDRTVEGLLDNNPQLNAEQIYKLLFKKDELPRPSFNSLFLRSLQANIDHYKRTHKPEAGEPEERKIAVIIGSPRKNGNTDLLAHAFINGAEKAGHAVTVIYAADQNIHSCIGCNVCYGDEHKCVYHDDMIGIYRQLADADTIVFATPIYFYGVSSQLKCLIDRLHNPVRNDFKVKKLVLLSVCADTIPTVFDSIRVMYRSILDYFCLEDGGMVLADGVVSKGDIQDDPRLDEAELLGERI